MLLWLTHTTGIRVIELNHKRRGFGLSVKRCEHDADPKEYRASDAPQQTLSRLYRQAGIKLGSSHSGHRTLACMVLADTGDVEMAQAMLCHQDLDHTKPYLSADQETIKGMHLTSRLDHLIARDM